ncbi:retrovirus-related pol polyprotein from transposon TNT 1-94 [Tanacetum coccineum]|uniref:Retrovirus-related pol polyprotein from transposon TNT 1-94 n=1 Tax=Tanacetum coccineum TaxID=301880 RepID=A0ABQ4XNG6_9ASTR
MLGLKRLQGFLELLLLSQYNDVKTMFAAIETQFGGNEATKKTQKTLLKQQYENFSASSVESLDSIFNRLQKIVSRLAFLVWMNKPEIEIISIDDLCNNFIIVKQKVKKYVAASSGAQNLAFITAPSTSSTNDVNTASPQVSTASPNVNTASPQVSTTRFNDNAMYAFMVENPNGSNLLHQDLKKIHEDDLEAMDLKWQLSLLSMRAKRYYQRTGHFAKECRAPRSKEGQFKNQDNTRKQGNNEDTSSKAMLAIDGVGLDWSDMAEEQCDDLIVKLNQTEFTAATYKRASKDLDKLLESQITDKSKKGLGYSDVPPPYSGLDEFKEPEFKGYDSEDSKKESNVVCDKKSDDSKENSDNSLVKEQVSKGQVALFSLHLMLIKKLLFLLINGRGKPQQDDTGFVDSGCSRHMTGNIAYLSDFKEFDGGYVTFGGGAHGGRISGKGTLKTDSLDFEDVYFVNDCLLKIPRKDNMYSFDMKNIVPKESLTCLVAKATSDESMLWHRRLGHINFKNINKLVKDNLVRGLPIKGFENDQTSVACLKGKKHRASCMSKVLNLITKPLFMLHMDLFGPTFMSSLRHKKYCLVVTDDYSRSDNGTKFKNKVMDDFCRAKGIKREYSIARTPQQNGVAKRRNRTLIEAARTMLAESKLPTTFWAEAVSTACYVQNKVLVVKPYNKTPYELFRGFKPALSFMRPFRCHVTILNTLDNLGKFDGKIDEGTSEEISQDCIVMPIWKDASYFDSSSKDVDISEPKSAADDQKQVKDGLDNKNDEKDKSDNDSSPKEVNVIGQHVNTASHEVNNVDPSVSIASSNDQDSPKDMFTMGASPTLEATHVWILVDLPVGKRVIGRKWVFRNKKDKRGIVIRNKARLVAQGHRQEEGISYEEVFTPVARIEAIRLFLAYASFMGFLVYQIDVKSAFLYGTIEEEVYVTQPPGFKDPDHPNKVYKVVKALYGLHQAPRAWYETLANYMLGNGFKRGKIDQTLFIKKQKGDILLVQFYVDDIIFGSTNKDLLQQKEDGIFISHNKYVAEILKKFNYTDVKSALTLVDLEKPLVKDGDADDVDVHLYRYMIGSLMYLTASRPDIMFAVCACTRFQVTSKTSHLLAVKRIFRYLKGKPTLGLWYSRDSPFELVAYTDSDYTGATQDRKSTTGGCQFLGNRHVKKGRDTKIPQSSSPPIKVGDEAVHKELGDIMERVATTASSLEVERDIGSSPECQDTILGDVDAQTRFETTSKQSYDPPLSRGYTLGSGEDSLKLLKLMLLCTNLQKQVLDLEKAKDAQAKEIADLKKRVQRLERKKKSRTTGLTRLKKVGMSRRGRSDDVDMFDINDLHGDEVNVDMPVGGNQEQSAKEREVDTSLEDSATPTTIEEITLAQTLIQIKAAKPKVVTTAATTTITTRPKAREVVVQEPSEFRTPQEAQPSKIKDKSKAIMIEPEVPQKKKDQVALDEDLARNLQAQLEAELIEEEKLASKQEE